ncbi:ROK family protein [Uliginosibacterium paludis]|uniref:ROK family transcriptional regulator n=1 Tax=Uliginosibacterium paludis TaxID=1615952 RepID=A0ABV2CVD3_9RHOO
MAITGDQRLLKRINRMAMVRLVRARPGLSRADLAAETGLTKSTVSLLVQELIDEGWLREENVLITGAIGRRPTPLKLDGQRLGLIGAELEVGGLIVLGMSLDGKVLHESRHPLKGDEAPADVMVRMAGMIADMARQLREHGRGLLGIGVALPGAVLESEGILMTAPNLGWRKVPVRADLARELEILGLSEVPLFVRNDCDVAALGEIEFSPGKSGDPLVFIGLGVGVGAGVVVGQRLLVGQRGFAGEIGHLQLQHDGPACSCGRRGCAEAYFGLNAIAASLGCSPREVFERAHRAEPAAVKALQAAGQRLGMLMHNLWTTLDPALIVLGGSGCELGPAFLNAAERSFEALAQSSGIDMPEIRRARYGAHAVPAGAAALVLHKLLLPI